MAVIARRSPRSLDQQVTFERLTEVSRADTGSVVERWLPLVRCWASVDGTKASERYAGGGERSVGDYTLWIMSTVYAKYKPTPKDRIVWGTRVLNIIDIPDQQLRGQLIAVFANSGLHDG